MEKRIEEDGDERCEGLKRRSQKEESGWKVPDRSEAFGRAVV